MIRCEIGEIREEMMDLERIRGLIREGKITDAVEALEEWLNRRRERNVGVRRWLDELIIHNSSIQALDDDTRKGVITKEERAVEARIIASSVLNLISKIEAEDDDKAKTRLSTSTLKTSMTMSSRRILVLAANPVETDRLQIDEEVRIIRQRLQEASSGRDYRVESEWAVRATDISKFLLEYEPAIVHFSGHGSPTGDIIVQDEAGHSTILSISTLADLFGILSGATECVVLNACYSFERARQLANHVACVVGMEKAIGDPSALRCSAGFYRGLAFGRSYEDAFRLGCNEIDLATLPDYSVPQFTTRESVRVLDAGRGASPEGIPLRAPTRSWVTVGHHEEEADRPDTPRIYPVWFATDRQPLDVTALEKGFSTDRALDDRAVYYGVCHVAIPKSHRFGSVGSGWWRRFRTADDDRLKLVEILSWEREKFWGSVQQAMAERERLERVALVFIHGFRITFEEAAIRTAQIGFDLKVPGITAFFSWPSKGRLSLLDYTADEATIEASAVKITHFLTGFAEQSGAERIHVIAHSMGNRGLLRAMDQIMINVGKASEKKFHHIVFAAPDVDSAVFRQLAKNYRAIGEHATMYVSSRDRAIASSGIVHRAARAGFVPPVTLVEHIDTIEVSNIDLTLLGHGYYGAAEGVLYDMRELLFYDTPPKSRTRVSDSGQGYWIIAK
jgi:esterase/lipase superfamily enzyme